MSARGQSSARAEKLSRHPRHAAAESSSSGARHGKAQRRGGAVVPGPSAGREARAPGAAAASTQQHCEPISSEDWLCNFCLEIGAKRLANVWCATCVKYMCPGCIRQHSIFSRGHYLITQDEFKAWDGRCLAGGSDVASIQPTWCTVHSGRPLELVCITCCRCLCIECRPPCDSQKHEVRSIADPSIDGYVRKLKDEGLSLRQGSCCLSRSAVGKRQAMRATRDRFVLKVRRRRRAVLDAINVAYAAAEKELLEVLNAGAASAEYSSSSSSATGGEHSPASEAAAACSSASVQVGGDSAIAGRSSGGCGRCDKCGAVGRRVIDSFVEEQQQLLLQLESLLTAMHATCRSLAGSAPSTSVATHGHRS